VPFAGSENSSPFSVPSEPCAWQATSVVRSLSPVEAALCVAIAGSVLAVGVPAFVRNLHASRLVEPLDGLKRIAEQAAQLATERPAGSAYPESIGFTPATVPRGSPALDPPGTWDKPTWLALRFGFSEPHSYSFAFESDNKLGLARFKARARGDLDGDGQFSDFSLAGEARDGARPVSFAVEMTREVE
jgi:hypothetical protein